MGILLCMLGGVSKGHSGADGVPLRGDIHTLVVGDPGLGKSQLLQVRVTACRMLHSCRLWRRWCDAAFAPYSQLAQRVKYAAMGAVRRWGSCGPGRASSARCCMLPRLFAPAHIGTVMRSLRSRNAAVLENSVAAEGANEAGHMALEHAEGRREAAFAG